MRSIQGDEWDNFLTELQQTLVSAQQQLRDGIDSVLDLASTTAHGPRIGHAPPALGEVALLLRGMERLVEYWQYRRDQERRYGTLAPVASQPAGCDDCMGKGGVFGPCRTCGLAPQDQPQRHRQHSEVS